MNDVTTPDNLTGFEIAVIGMACRFPGASNIEEYRQNLEKGIESISFFSDEELKAQGIYPTLLEYPDYVKAGAILQDIDAFDAAFFGYNPREAETMDPQQRLFLELAWQALEAAGCDSDRFQGLIGIFAGAGASAYLFNLYSDREISESIGGFEALIGNAGDHLCTRAAYKLNLEGPAVSVQTACSTALTAVHLACRSLVSGDCDMALAGGVSLHIPQITGHLTQPGWIISPDGHCRAFDARAKGTVNGSGLGIVVLKRLADALEAGDHIHAVIKGSAINNDGSMKIGYTAPRSDGQAKVIRAAQLMAEIPVDTIGYIETHGTGTELGDPIEIQALARAFRETTDKKGFCAVGSVKSNFGHLDSAAGAAGLIKAVLSLEHRLLFPSLHFESANPKIDLAGSPFYVNTKLSPWPQGAVPRRAAVSSFGIGGTNVHVVLEEAPPVKTSAPGRPYHLLLLSARTGPALETAAANMSEYFKQHAEINMADAAYTLQTGRRVFAHRLMLVSQDQADAARTLAERDPKRIFSQVQEQEDAPVAFMFPGQGAQYTGMAYELYRQEPLFHEVMQQCFEILKPLLGYDLRERLYPAEIFNESNESYRSYRSNKTYDLALEQTEVAQPALFVVEYALTRLLLSWGIKPQAMAGHSIGEYTAACLAGVFSLQDALALVALRGKLMQSMPPGAMLGVPLAETEIQAELGPGLTLAAVNGPKLCVVSGPVEAVAALQQRLTQSGVTCTPLHTSHAFHSPMMEPIMIPFAAQVEKIALHAPSIPYLSNLTGKWITAQEVLAANYWSSHLRQTVRFGDNLAELLKNPRCILLEVGPGRTLTTLAKQHPGKDARQAMLSTLRHAREPQPDQEFLFNTIGRLWLAGAKIDWPGMYAGEKRRRVSLPAYPFEKQRYWVELKKRDAAVKPAAAPQAPAVKRANIDDWFYRSQWRQKELPAVDDAFFLEEQAALMPGWIIFADQCGLADMLAARCREDNQEAVIVRPGENFQESAPGNYTIDPQSADDYHALFAALNENLEPPWKIVHLWGVTRAAADRRPGREAFEEAQHLGFYSLLYLAQAIGKQAADAAADLIIAVVTDHTQRVADEPLLYPEKATVLGPCKVISKEFPGITCRSIDIEFPQPEEVETREQVVQNLMLELSSDAKDAAVAYRGGQRFVQVFTPVRLKPLIETDYGIVAAEGGWIRLRENGTYLISGGLGGMGLTFATYLAQTVQANLILLDNLALPPIKQQRQWLATHPEDDPVSRKIRSLDVLLAAGSEVFTVDADVEDERLMRKVIKMAEDSYGPIHGVIHTAGIAGGGMMRLRSREAVEKVFAPKIHGLYVLDSLLKKKKLDFVVLCSSLTALLGEYGQADYCAANIFLDAFAQQRAAGQPFTVAINWDTWKEVGMAVNSASGLEAKSDDLTAEPGSSTADRQFTVTCLEKKAERVVYTTELNSAAHWVLAEHRLNGIPLLPGTAYLEIVRAAFADYTGDTHIEIREIVFAAPMLAPEGEMRTVCTIFTPQAKGFRFAVASMQEGQPDDKTTWQEHAHGEIAALTAPTPKKRDIKKIEQACGLQAFAAEEKGQAGQNIFKGVGALSFGPRWQNLLKAAGLSEKQACAHLALPDIFAGDLEHYYLHPALLDAAGSFAAAAKGAYLPFSYKNIKIYQPLAGEIFSHIAWLTPDSFKKETLHLHVLITDEHGHTLTEIGDYTLRKVPAPAPGIDHETESRSFHLEIGAPGILDTLTWSGGARRKPGSGEIEIAVQAVGLNFKDVLVALTAQPGNISAEARSFGSECAGKITALGKGVQGLQVGDEVTAAAPGCFSTYLTTPARYAAAKPGQFTFEEAAAIPIAFMTANYALNHLARLQPGERVLIHAAAGGVGLAAVQYAQLAKAEIFATAGSPAKREYLRSLGVQHIMNSRTLDFAGEIMGYTGGVGVDVVLNSLAGEFMAKSLETLAPFGRFLEIGKRDIYQGKQMGLAPFQKGIAFFSVNLSPQLPAYRAILLEVLEGFREGKLKMLPYKVFPAVEARQAFDYMAQAKHTGKIVISMKEVEAAQAAASAASSGQVRAKSAAAGVPLIDLEAGISPKEGVEVLKRVLAGSLAQVTVSTRDLQQRIMGQAAQAGRLWNQAGTAADVVAAPAQQHARPALQTEYVSPQNDTQRVLARIWQEVLGIDQVGIHDNFFDLGGASLQSIQAAAQAGQAGIEITPELLFEFQTISEIDAALKEKGATK